MVRGNTYGSQNWSRTICSCHNWSPGPLVSGASLHVTGTSFCVCRLDNCQSADRNVLGSVGQKAHRYYSCFISCGEPRVPGHSKNAHPQSKYYSCLAHKSKQKVQHKKGCGVRLLRDPPRQRPPRMPDCFMLARMLSVLICTLREQPPHNDTT